MARLSLLAIACALAAVLAGCGGPEDAVAPPTPPPDGGDAAPVQVGPLLVRPASAAGFVVEPIATEYGPVSLVALHGSRISYLASQALLDRIVFSRGSGLDFDICVCNLDGSGTVKLVNSTALDEFPAWSPDGARIAFQRYRLGQDNEIVAMGADGSSPYALTSNTDDDKHPTWSPEGRRIAFETDRDGNDEVYLMYDDGSGATNLTGNGAADRGPDWSSSQSNPTIYFASDRDAGDYEIYRMPEDGSVQTRITYHVGYDVLPACDPSSSRIAWASWVQGTFDIMVSSGPSSAPHNLSATPDSDAFAAWSSDGRFICFRSYPDGTDAELVLQQTDPPYDQFVLTDNGVDDTYPDLGSPTMQTDRVIIGPAGSDWGGRNPIWTYSDAGIAAYDESGYRNFVRIAVRPEDLSSLDISPLSAPAANGFLGDGAPLGVLVEAAEIVSLREDAGRGRQSVLWQLDPLDATAAVLYFNTWTGKLVAVMTIADQSYPAGAGHRAAAVGQRFEAGATVTEGDFSAVFDATGARIGGAAVAVRITDDAVTVVR